MHKNTIKKIILTIILLSVLILSLMFFFRISSEDYSDDVTIVKKIIKEKYDDVVYSEKSNYLYAYIQSDNSYEYIVFDYNGNKLYEFNSLNKLNIVSVSKKYFIVKDSKYHLYNNSFEEIISGDNIYSISDYLIYVDSNIINFKGEELFKNVNNIESYYKNKYFIVDNYFINSKGKILLENYKIIKEKINNNEIDYFIVKKDSKYYCFFPLVNKIIGDEFDRYFEYNDKTYIVSKNKVYMIHLNGLRKEIVFDINNKVDKASINYLNAVKKNKVLVLKDDYLGVLETSTNKFYKIVKTNKYAFEYIDEDNINISCNDKNYVYNLKTLKIIYTNNFDEIVIFDNNYKTIKRDNYYYLLDDNDKKVISSDKQIILINSKIKIGKPNREIALFDKELYYGESIIVNKNIYYKYKTKDINKIVSFDLKEEYKSDKYLNYMNDTIVKLDNNKLCFYNVKTKKTYYYDMEDFNIYNDEINKNEIIIYNNKNIIVLDKKGNTIKKIKNVKLINAYYNNSKQAIIMIVEKNKLNKKYIGTYILK